MRERQGRLMKRFYKTVSVAPADDGYVVKLDGRVIKTPLKEPLTLPTKALANKVAAEWDHQGEEVDPKSMPFTQLSNGAQDLLGQHRDQVVETLVGFIDADLICYRARNPDDLVARQTEHWQPLVDWFADEFGVALNCTNGFTLIAQDQRLAPILRRHIQSYNNFQISALHELATISKSISIALAVTTGRLSFEQAWAVARVDEDFQISRWGEDEEAAENARMLHQSFEEAALLWHMVSE
jgi:chaperone required for assembly of F1-ATPase